MEFVPIISTGIHDGTYAGVVGRLRKVELSLIIQGQSWQRHRTLYTIVIWSESILIHTDIHILSSPLITRSITVL